MHLDYKIVKYILGYILSKIFRLVSKGLISFLLLLCELSLC
jgi:hypothetical protein